jgi:CDP-glucose 4,6-dehydratase
MTSTSNHKAPSTDFDLSSQFKGRKVLITGHTGFKGGWLAVWLSMLGAKVYGVALEPDTNLSFFASTGLGEIVDDRRGDIRNTLEYAKSIEGIDAEIVFHLAAQALVKKSYADPVGTFATNVVGTANVLTEALKMPSLKAIVVVTSDKCYENHEWVWGYRENDRMGGSDPYSASKGCTELLVNAFRKSYFKPDSGKFLATVRAGNVFGGGDWSQDRLVPDIVKAAANGTIVKIRNPASIRPWQHVLDPLSGYLLLASRLLSGDASYATGWNFGPDESGAMNVRDLAESITSVWGTGAPEFDFGVQGSGLHEAQMLRLDCTKARTELNWSPQLSTRQAIEFAIDWYKMQAAGKLPMLQFTQQQILNYMKLPHASGSRGSK